jgi:hypothetical protein
LQRPFLAFAKGFLLSFCGVRVDSPWTIIVNFWCWGPIHRVVWEGFAELRPIPQGPSQFFFGVGASFDWAFDAGAEGHAHTSFGLLGNVIVPVWEWERAFIAKNFSYNSFNFS